MAYHGYGYVYRRSSKISKNKHNIPNSTSSHRCRQHRTARSSLAVTTLFVSRMLFLRPVSAFIGPTKATTSQLVLRKGTRALGLLIYNRPAAHIMGERSLTTTTRSVVDCAYRFPHRHCRFLPSFRATATRQFAANVHDYAVVNQLRDSDGDDSEGVECVPGSSSIDVTRRPHEAPLLPTNNKENGFQVTAPYSPTGDQPEAIEECCRQLLMMNPDDSDSNMQCSILQGITGTGKTLVMSHVIARLNKPTLVLCHNKTLAAQLARELKSFLSSKGQNNNGGSVELFVSYYNHYVPESFVETTGKYIAKKSSINHEIDILRHRATRALLTRDSVVVVASVSCIYGLGLPKEYLDASWNLNVGEVITMWDQEVTEALKRLLFEQVVDDDAFERGTYQIEEMSVSSSEVDNNDGGSSSAPTRIVTGRRISVWPPHEKYAVQIEFTNGNSSNSENMQSGQDCWIVDSIKEGAASGLREISTACIFPARHHVTSDERLEGACVTIEEELEDRLSVLRSQRKFEEADRLQQRVLNDVMMLKETGFCSGGENYSRHLAGRAAGEPPETLLDYMGMFGNREWLLMVDESHVTLPQLKAMYAGDQARKRRLVKHGYRLPSALDNRPLKESEFWDRVKQTLFVSATPSKQELSVSNHPPVEMLIRPTFVCDPEIEVRPTEGQLDDLLQELETICGRQERALIMTLTKRDAEDLSSYLNERGLNSTYIHSGMTTNERSNALKSLQVGEVDCLVGINCLREGLDLPQVSLVAVLNADSEGFLRSETALLQVVGRAARNVNGRAILYAKRKTRAMKKCIDDTRARRKKQMAYNKLHNCKMKSTKGSSTFSIFDLMKDELESEQALQVQGKNRDESSSENHFSIPKLNETSHHGIDVNHIPSLPGVYFWKDSDGNNLYIGKANKLRSRVKSYLSPKTKLSSRIKAMISKAASVDIVLSQSPRDALLLESNLIKHHQPPFNVLLKDDEHYPYICASLGDQLPRFSLVPRCPENEKSKNRYFGPYTSFAEINAILQAIEGKYDLRAKSFEVRQGSGSKEEYIELFNCALQDVFSPKNSKLENSILTRRLEYEEANLLFESKFNQCRDIVTIAPIGNEDSSEAIVHVAQLRHRIVANSFSYSCHLPFGLESSEDRAIAIQTVLERQHYPSGRESSDSRFTWFPDEVLLQETFDWKGLRSVIRRARAEVEVDRRGSIKVTTAASRGPKKMADERALQFASDNARQAANEHAMRHSHGAIKSSIDGTAAKELADILSLTKAPSRIECYDISHTQGEKAVGSRVVFIDGKPSPQLYRQFNVRLSEGVDPRDDYSSLRQVLHRRFARATSDGPDDWKAPDLVVIDGGPGQLGAALKGMADARRVVDKDRKPSCIVPICSLAKNQEEVFVVGKLKPVNKAPDTPALLLLRAIRDESHRFALNSHRRRRSITRSRSGP